VLFQSDAIFHYPMNISPIILAAGHGKRMQSALPKPLVTYRGRPIIEYAIESVEKAHFEHATTIVIAPDEQGKQIKDATKSLGTLEYVIQKERLGTGHAVLACREALEKTALNVLVFYGDHPLVSAKTWKDLATIHLEKKADVTLVTVKLKDYDEWRKPLYDFGRIIRDADGRIDRIVEKVDASAKQLEIKEVNPGFYCFRADWLWKHLPMLKNENSKGEYYLTDIIGLAVLEHAVITDIQINPKEALGVNTKEQLALIETIDHAAT